MTTSTTVLPETCPTWCASGPAGHLQALDEGCPQEDARIHMSADLVGVGTDMAGERVRWGVELRSDPGENCNYYGKPILELEVCRTVTDRTATAGGLMRAPPGRWLASSSTSPTTRTCSRERGDRDLSVVVCEPRLQYGSLGRAR